jgi:hypothetical protein
MRLWSLHPKYLDSLGLVALWREALLAKRVLEDRTRGYRHHPQLSRFRELPDPVRALNVYLSEIWLEAGRRGFRFDRNKYDANARHDPIPTTRGQLVFETQHLKNKLEIRDEIKYQFLMESENVEPHPLFVIVDGSVAPWEKTHE